MEYNRITSYQKYNLKSFFNKLECSDYSDYIERWTDEYRYLTNLFLAIDDDNNIVGYMFLCKYKKKDKYVKIKLIDTFIGKNNIALKMMSLFENKNNKILLPEEIADDAVEYWKKINKSEFINSC